MKIGRIIGILLVMGLVLALVSPALATVDTGQTVPRQPAMDSGKNEKGGPGQKEMKVKFFLYLA